MTGVRRGAAASWIVASMLLLAATASRAADGDKAARDAAADALFAEAAVPRLRIRLSPAEAESLRQHPRSWTTCTLVEDGSRDYESAAIKIKGAYGSFRDLDDRPALTLKMDRHAAGRHFHGLRKFHLNNSVQDDSLLREWLGSGIFRSAGIPAPRVTHARVWIDGRDVGLYVLRESFDEEFLRRSFPRPDGNLYEAGPLQDIDEDVERDEGARGEPGADLAAFAAACRTPEDAGRRLRLEEVLDVEAFLTFAGLEALIGHWDGYCGNRNNYRVYADPGVGGRARFLPHGMDQILGDAGAAILEPPPALVALTVMENPAWRRRHRERMRELLPLVAADRLLPLVAAADERLRPIVIDVGPEALERFDAAVAHLREVIAGRTASLREQLDRQTPILWPTRLQAAARGLAAADQAHAEGEVRDHRLAETLRNHVPWFECPDRELERDYYRRWWTLLRRVDHTDAGAVVKDFPPEFGDLVAEARWLRDLRLVGLEAAPRSVAGTAGSVPCDRVITGFVGLRVHPDDTVEVDPAPPVAWDWFAMDRIAYHGRIVSVVWDRSGERYGRQGLGVFVDGTEVARAETLRRVIARLP